MILDNGMKEVLQIMLLFGVLYLVGYIIYKLKTQGLYDENKKQM